jgi:hypothetical protein
VGTLGALLLGSGPRFARDALGPVLAFYAVWKFWGLLAGIVAATLVALVAVANGLYGCVFIGSVAFGRPLAGVFARDMLRSAGRLLVLLWSSIELFVGVSIVTGIPCTLALMTWSFWYPLRAFQRQPELWGAEEPPASAGAS